MAKEKPATTASNRMKMKLRYKLLLIIFSLVMMALLRTGFVFFVIGMMPAIVAYYMDATKYRYIFRSVFAANMAGMFPFIMQILHQGPTSMLLQQTMGSAFVWFVIYGASFLGWLLTVICPYFAQTMVVGLHQTQHARLEWLQKKLESEWGSEVKQFIQLAKGDA